MTHDPIDRTDPEGDAEQQEIRGLGAPECNDETVSRRRLLRGAAAALAGGGAVALVNAEPARAGYGDPILAGKTNFSTVYTGLGSNEGNTTFFATSGALTAPGSGGATAALVGDSANSSGVAGLSDHAFGVLGRCGAPSGAAPGTCGVSGDSHDKPGVVGSSYNAEGTSGTSTWSYGLSGNSTHADGVFGYSGEASGISGLAAASARSGVSGQLGSPSGLTSPGGVVGDAQDAVGAAGLSLNNTGVYGLTGAASGTNAVAGVVGDSATRYGVAGLSHNTAGLYGNGARGAVLSGRQAQARLVPSSAATHPAGGSAGDLFVDTAGRLWFCSKTSSTAATWVRLA